MQKKIARPFVNILSPMPGTSIWTDAEQEGLVSSDMDWNRLRGFAAAANSENQSFDDFIEKRFHGKTIYLAEKTLPQKRLLELMKFYESVIEEIVAKQQLEEKYNNLVKSNKVSDVNQAVYYKKLKAESLKKEGQACLYMFANKVKSLFFYSKK